ncbi:MAG: hypothetical protein ACTSXQ_03305 [Alphaproteobacteria bacterium]
MLKKIEKEIEKIPNISKLDSEKLKEHIQKFPIDKTSSVDSYTLSPSYYAMTGRKGAWIYQKNNTALVLCWHPNVENEILIFPEIGPSEILEDLLQEISFPLNMIKICRVPEINAEKIHQRLSSHIPTERAKFKIIDEPVLDWRYPVHILSTKNVCKMQGKAFSCFRGRYNKITKNHSLKIRHLSNRLVSQNKHEIEDLLKRWSLQFGERLSGGDWLGHVELLLNLYQKEDTDLYGTTIYCDDDIVESVNIFDKPLLDGLASNYLSPFFNKEIKGLSEFSYYTVCSALYNLGFETLNIGGSENEHLDRYKRKFAPIKSIRLKTIEIL